jgi:hypothetical protein
MVTRARGRVVPRARERVAVLAFALTLLVVLVGGAFVLGYIVGKLVL